MYAYKLEDGSYCRVTVSPRPAGSAIVCLTLAQFRQHVQGK